MDLKELRLDLKALISAMRKAGVPAKLLSSIHRKCLRTPRRQTGRIERRTNRDPRWTVAEDHPDYSSEMDAHLVWLILLLDMLAMRNAPYVDPEITKKLSEKYFCSALRAMETQDPLTAESLDYFELVKDIVEKPKHGYSRFHIGHQDPRLALKHLHSNVRWQLKASNDFQRTMDINVARVAFHADRFSQTGDQDHLKRAYAYLGKLEELTRSRREYPSH